MEPHQQGSAQNNKSEAGEGSSSGSQSDSRPGKFLFNFLQHSLYSMESFFMHLTCKKRFGQ